MLKSRGLAAAGLVLLLAVFGWGVVELLKLRFAAGDVYPPYSSFRRDPLGTRALYESFQELGAGDVRRNLQPVNPFPDGKGATLFVFGLPANELRADADEFKKLDAFVRGGGRLVVTLYPSFVRPAGSSGRRATNSPAFNPSGGRRGSDDADIDLGARWGFSLAYVPVRRQRDYTFPSLTARALRPEELPETISWHSALVFTNINFEWRVLYARQTDPVLIERALGAGSIVLATDSFFVSNEALQKERASKLLVWLAGPYRELIFNETHLGVVEQPGVAALARRYNLHGAAVALLVLALLFVWKSSVAFVPAPATNDSAAVTGRESTMGFTNLLRRSVPPSELLQVCLDQWHKARHLDRRASPRKIEEIRAVVEAHNGAARPNLPETYNRIACILNNR